jgi:hypothetical protein
MVLELKLIIERILFSLVDIGLHGAGDFEARTTLLTPKPKIAATYLKQLFTHFALYSNGGTPWGLNSPNSNTAIF